MSNQTSLPKRPPERLEVKLFRSLLTQMGLMRRIMTPYFRRFGISGAQWAVLRSLARAQREGLQGLKPSDISGRLLIRPPSVTGVLNRLAREKLVQRLPSHADGRMKLVSLTAEGEQLVQRIEAVHSKQVRQLMTGLSRTEQKQMQQLLDRLNEHLVTLAEEADEQE